MSETFRIAELLEQTFGGKAYYGNSVLRSLEGITAEIAARRPDHGKNSIWSLVLHLTAELNYHRKLIDGTAGRWVAGETTWTDPADINEKRWEGAINDLKEANRRLVASIRAMPEKRLNEIAYPLKYSIYRSLHGTLHHSIYHAGQITILRRQLGAL